MRLAIFGSTGGTGRELVRLALEAGHDVTAFARTPAKLGATHERLRIIQGDVADPARVAEAVEGADAVLSTLHPDRRAPRSFVAGTRHIVAACRSHGVRLLVVTTGAGIRAPEDRPQAVDRVFAVALRLVARPMLEASRAGMDEVRRSGLDWTIARAPRLTNGGGTGAAKAGFLGPGAGTSLARADFARFVLEQAGRDEWTGRMPVVTQ